MSSPQVRADDRLISALQATNSIVFVIAGAVVFGATMDSPGAQMVGIVTLVWLFAFGSGALWLDHQLLNQARLARHDVPLKNLFGRKVRRALREAPDTIFDSAHDAERYKALHSQIFGVVIVASLALFALLTWASWEVLGDLHYILFTAPPSPHH
ncbi:MAG: hypothetical protein ACI81R_003809 [Bradymonadia bacterium]|jgi:hypothetical protein